jgi:hypothetical protein
MASIVSLLCRRAAKSWATGAWPMPAGYTRRLAGEASGREVPSHWLECAPRCLYITAVPLVQRGHYAGTVVLAAGLQDLIMDFRRLSGAELAVLDARGGSVAGHVISVSGGFAYQELLRSLRPGEDRGDVFQVERSDRHFRFHRFDAPTTGVGGSSFSPSTTLPPNAGKWPSRCAPASASGRACSWSCPSALLYMLCCGPP